MIRPWLFAIAVLLLSGPASAQELCGQAVPPPAKLPPDGSPPVVYYIGICFSAQGNVSAIEPETYLFHVKLQPSLPSRDQWVPWGEAAEETVLQDFQRLWDTGFLDDLSIESEDYTFANGVIGKVITYHLEERARIKLVSYEGTTSIDRSTIDEKLREASIDMRLDSFLDPRAIAKVKSTVRRMMAEKGFPNAEVSHVIKEQSGPKLVGVVFTISDGPNVAIRDVEFLGNRALSDATLSRVMKGNRAQNVLSPITGKGRYNEAAFEEDAQSLEDHYKNHGYVEARVGAPEVRALDDSADGRIRWVQLRVPVTEGRQFRMGALTFEGNQLVASDALRQLFPITEGDWYSQAVIRKGLEKAREVYGAAGYMEFTGFPSLTPGTEPPMLMAGPPVVDVVLRITEGPQYLVNRLTFRGNTTTRDHVIRREVQLIEGGVFNTEALKYSVRRLNQLGYFKPLEGNESDLQVEKSTARANSVDVTLTFEEQNRNQLQFGAGMSQYDGVFGNLSYTTSNFMGRGESLTLTAQKGARSGVYQVSFSEPYVFSRPMSAGVDLFTRKVDYLTGVNSIGYSEVRSGINVTGGHSLFRFARVLMSYGYEVIDTAVSNDLLDSLDRQGSVGVPLFNPFLDEGRHIESRISPVFVHNTVDNPFAPRTGMKLQVQAPIAGSFLGGTTDYVRPEVEGILYIPHLSRTAVGLRANVGWVRPFGRTSALPYYLRYFLGGEYQIRGVDIRTVGPTDEDNRALGGDKFVLFNAEYYLDLFRSVRLLAFHDAGQAYSEKQPIDLRHLRTSSGFEARVMVPMLNVPFRLIYAWNTYRDTFQPARGFKFAVGTTF
jgi:outer membrane protein insertion porin family